MKKVIYGILSPLHSQHIARGWWNTDDGAERGELYVNPTTGKLISYDCRPDLPQYIKDQIENLDIEIH